MIKNGVTAIEGQNLSGRTTFLREFVGLDNPDKSSVQDGEACAYLGLDIINYFSGLEPSVEKELHLHGYGGSLHKPLMDSLIASAQFEQLLGRNPFTLSGGEQTFFATLNAIALDPNRLAIDGAFEQLDSELRQRILSELNCMHHSESQMRVCISDNRLKEYNLSVPVVQMDGEGGKGSIPPTMKSISPLEAPVEPASIRMDNLSFHYPKGGNILNSISHEFSPGEIYLLSGKNGVGKSTLCKILCGILKPESGSIYCDGKKVFPWKKPAQQVAYHFQNPDMQLFHKTVHSELGFDQSLSEGHLKYLNQVTEAFGLRDHLDSHPFDLPYVLRKRLAMAATVAMGRPWLILDEPTLSQDQRNVKELVAILNALASCGVGIIVITHSLWLSENLKAIKLLLEDGELITV